MKIKLTEQQARNIFKKINEDVDTNADLSSMYEKLSQLGNFFNGNSSNNQVSQPIGTDVTGSLDTISNGSEMYHPLGHKAPISSYFGKRNSEVGPSNHKGVDIPTSSGSPVYAPLDGTVLNAMDTTPNGCGGFISLDHKTLETKFCHLSKWVVRKGDKVKRGQIIGYSGGGQNDPYHGSSTGPHLHYEILNTSGIAMNPTSIQPNLT